MLYTCRSVPCLWIGLCACFKIFTYFHSKPEFATFGSSSGHNHFSFENCSKELESIMGEVPSSNALVSSCRASPLRPRSSSLPSQSKSEFRSSPRSKVDLSKKGCQGGVSLPHKVGYCLHTDFKQDSPYPVVQKACQTFVGFELVLFINQLITTTRAK